MKTSEKIKRPNVDLNGLLTGGNKVLYQVALYEISCCFKRNTFLKENL